MSSRIDQIVACVDGGVARNLDELVRETLGLDGTDDLTDEEREELDQELFTCESCGWTMPRDDESEEEPDTCDECVADSLDAEELDDDDIDSDLDEDEDEDE